MACCDHDSVIHLIYSIDFANIVLLPSREHFLRNFLMAVKTIWTYGTATVTRSSVFIGSIVVSHAVVGSNDVDISVPFHCYTQYRRPPRKAAYTKRSKDLYN